MEPTNSLVRTACLFKALPGRGIIGLQSRVQQHTPVWLRSHANRPFASQSDQRRASEKVPQLRYCVLCRRNEALYERNSDILRPNRSDQLTQARVCAVTANGDISH